MKRNLIVRQQHSKDCGSACLLSIIRYYKGNIGINSLIELTKTNKDGTNFYNIMKASQSLGLDSKCYKIENINYIYQIDRPFISQVIYNNLTHFIVVYKIKNKKITIMDPGRGRVIMNIKDFLDIWTGYVMLFVPYKKIPVIKSDNYLKNILIEVFLDNKKLILKISLLSLIFAIMTCLYSFYINIIIDVINLHINTNLFLISLVFGLFTIIKNITNYSRYEILLYLNQKIDISMVIDTFNKILLLPYNYYKNKTTGEVISRINDLASIKNLCSKIIMALFLDIIIIVIATLILGNISFTMFRFLLIIIFIYLVSLFIFRPILNKLTKINLENSAKINSFFVENISGYETIKGLHIESIIKNKFSKLYSNSLEDNLAYNKINNLEIFINSLISNIGTIIIIYLGVIEINNGRMTMGRLIGFMTLMIYLLESIKGIMDLNKDFYYVKNSIDRINGLLEIDSVKFDRNDLLVTGNIVIKNLCFSYNSYNIVLDNINLKINNKEKILILGSSGSGKSTLLKILYKYYDIERDKIYINNYDIKDYGLGTIREQISYISQQEILYTDTIKNNIILDRNIKYNKFIDICKLVYVDDIVKDKFLGYDTMLEENGTNISGGQRQRIILARTLLKKSNIILIDEGFSEMDINLERKILKNIFNYFKNMTMIIVSHRLENMDLYDKVIKLDQGNIIDNISKDVIYG